MPFREIIVHNFWWKVSAFVIAVGAYVGLKSRSGDLPEFTARPGYATRLLVAHPIAVTKPATDTREFTVDPPQVDITVSGDSEILRKLRSREVRATVDLSDFRPGSNNVPVHVLIPDENRIKLQRVVPETVQVELITKE